MYILYIKTLHIWHWKGQVMFLANNVILTIYYRG